jgi:hypothetical protein
MSLLVAGGAIVIGSGVVIATIANPALLRPVLPLAAGALLLTLLWTHAAARTSARRAEVARSFAGLTVLHLGERYAVADRPLLGEYATRRDAARAALDRGSWAIIVQAWDRYFLLAAHPVTDAMTRGPDPVSFRSRAVADVIPAIRDERIA